MFGRLLMDNRLHRFMKGFVLSRRSLHAHVSRFYVVGPPPASPPCSMLLSVLQLFFCCPCLSLLVASWNRSPILNPEGRGEVCVLCFFFVAVPLVYFSGAIFCPSTVKMMCFLCMHTFARTNMPRCGDAQGAHLCTVSSSFLPALPLLPAMPRGRRRSRLRLPHRNPYRKLVQDEIRLAKPA